jgi:tripartite-type tricarboxylate transporter receptor subunit TctC
MLDRRQFAAMAAAFTLSPALPLRTAFAQAWPNRIVKLIVPFTPGGGTDISGRLIAARLSEIWGQQIVVENKPGAGGNIASEFVARSAPDGYTLYITAGGLAINRFLFSSINYDPIADFAPVTQICLFPNLLVVPTASSLHSVKDLIAYAKANPGKINFASPGHGTSPHMSGELFKYMAKVDMTHVPYRGASNAYTDLIAGRVDISFAVLASSLPLVRSGQLRALGVTMPARVQVAPEVPTIAESGVPGFENSSWFAFFVPAKTPPEIIKKMHTDTVAVLTEPAIRTKLDQQGLIPVGSTPEEMAAVLKAEMDKWGPVIKAAGIKADR